MATFRAWSTRRERVGAPFALLDCGWRASVAPRPTAAMKAGVEMSDRQPPVPQAFDEHRTAYCIPDEHGGNIILKADGKATWEHADGSKAPLTLDEDVVKAIASGIQDADMHAAFAEQRVKEAQAGETLEHAQPEGAAEGAKGEWLKAPNQREDRLVAQGPRFSSKEVTVHLLDDGTTHVWRGSPRREEQPDLPPEVQRAIVNATQNLFYARNLWQERFRELVQKG